MKKYRFFSAFLCTIFTSMILLGGCGKNNAENISETKAEDSTHVDPQLSALETTLASEPKIVARDGLSTILFMGLDKFEAPEYEYAYVNDQQCDFLMLFILDEKKETCDILHINRDTMTEIRRLGIGGGVASRFNGQLALAHTYGSGGSDSCLNAVKAVSHFLNGAPIDHYIAMTMAGVSKLNDMVGGVDVKIPTDMTSVDPSFVEGETVHLQGDQALRFVRSRSSLEDSSNLSRMERQRAYLEVFSQKLLEKIHSDEGFTSRSLLELSSDFQSDLTVNQLSSLAEEMKDYQLNPFTTIAGEAVLGEEFMEFYADPDSLDQVVSRLFCE